MSAQQQASTRERERGREPLHGTQAYKQSDPLWPSGTFAPQPKVRITRPSQKDRLNILPIAERIIVATCWRQAGNPMREHCTSMMAMWCCSAKITCCLPRGGQAWHVQLPACASSWSERLPKKGVFQWQFVPTVLRDAVLASYWLTPAKVCWLSRPHLPRQPSTTWDSLMC